MLPVRTGLDIVTGGASLTLAFTHHIPRLLALTRSDGSVVVSPVKIAKRYATGWFVIDFIACLPIDLITDNHGSNSANELSRLARLPRAMRLLRLFRLAKLAKFSNTSAFRFLKSADVHPAFIRLFKSVFWAALALHIMAGVWFMIATQADPSVETWIKRIHMENAPVGSQYIICVYFMLSTFSQLGIGDVTPR